MAESLPSGGTPTGREHCCSLTTLIAHFHAVGKISLYAALATAILLVITIYYLSGVEGEGYLAIFNTHAFTKKQLGLALFIAGSVLVVVTGLITWSVILYSTFRVAGPLYPLSRSLEGLILDGSAMIRNRRKTDALSDEYLRFSGGSKRLQFHYDTMHELVELALVQSKQPGPHAGQELTKTIQQLQELGQIVKL
ncbi:MAG: hypothetical protein HQL80_13165 [Magnetococcales bacterium]|nr:hypothetical protein [Magnetococcales bacterium]